MITIPNDFKTSTLNEIWAIHIHLEKEYTPYIYDSGSATGIAVISSGQKMYILDLTNSGKDSFKAFVCGHGIRYKVEFPDASASDKAATHGIYNFRSSWRGNIYTDYPKTLSFTNFSTQRIRITPMYPYLRLSTAPFHSEDTATRVINGVQYPSLNTPYDPVITKIGSINDKIDIIKSKSKTSNITFSFADDKNNTGITNGSFHNMIERYSEILCTSDKNYDGISAINQKCEIFSVNQNQVNDTIQTKTKIYEGKISKVSLANGLINVSVTAEKPFSNRIIPSYSDPLTNTLGTLAYGNYENSEGATMYSGRKLFPIPYAFSKDRFNDNYYTLPKNLVSYHEVNPHYYDKANNKFLPLLESDFTTRLTNTISEADRNYAIVDSNYRKKLLIKANIANDGAKDTGASGIIEGDSTHPAMSNSSVKNIYDNPSNPVSDSTYGGMHFYVNFTADAFSPDYSLITSYPSNLSPLGSIDIVSGYSHKLQDDVSIGVYYSYIDIYYTAHPSNTLNQYANTGGLNNSKLILADSSNNAVKHTIKNFTTAYFTANGGTHTPAFAQADVPASTYEGTISPSIRFCIPEYSANGITGQTYSYYWTCRIHNIKLQMKTAIDQTDIEQVEQAINQIDTLYIGVDGIKRSWDTANACNKPHEIHRDLLWRECGIQDTPQGWADIETARSSFNARFWVNKETDLEKTLDKLQEEGAFIFRYNTQGEPSYIYVKDSYVSADVNEEIGIRDISDIKSYCTSNDKLITKINFKYDKDPATNDYVSEATHEDSDARERYGMTNTLEQTMDKSLDIVVDSAGVTALANYYFKIASQTKSIVEFTLINPAKYGLEIGDIIKFKESELSNKIIGVMTGRLGDYYYMITSLRRTLGKGVKIQAREVYQS